jgi:hypothetical protein
MMNRHEQPAAIGMLDAGRSLLRGDSMHASVQRRILCCFAYGQKLGVAAGEATNTSDR